MQKIQSDWLVEILSSLFVQIFVIYILNLVVLPTSRQGLLFLNSAPTVILFIIGLIMFQLLINNVFANDFLYSFKTIEKQYMKQNDRDLGKKKLHIRKLVDSFLRFISIYNILLILPIILLINTYIFKNYEIGLLRNLYKEAIKDFYDPRLYIFMIMQLIHMSVLLYIEYNKTQKFIALGFKEMVEEKYNSEEAKKYPAYSRFWLYAFPIVVLLLWIFIHPLSLLLIKALH